MKKIVLNLIIVAILVTAVPMTLFAGAESMLKNDIKLIEKPRPFTKTVSISLLIKGGLFNETEKNNGIGTLASRVLIKSNKILETSEFYGAFINAKLTPYAFEISFSSPTENIDKVYADFEAFLLNPKFDENIFEHEKQLLLEELESSKDNPNSIAYNNFTALTFSGTPYALPVEGVTNSVMKLKPADVKKYYNDNFKGAMMVVAVAGNYDAKLINKLRATLEKIDKGSSKEFKCDNAEIKTSITKEDEDSRIQQAKLFIGYNAPSASSPQYPALKVLTELLGGGMSSRYFNEIRKNSGYAYAVGAAYPSRACSSRFFASAGLDYSNTTAAIKKIEDINLNLAKTITDEEIEKAKNSILGSALMETQTNSAVAWNATFFETMGLGADYYDKYVETLKKINKKELLNAAEIFKGPKTIYILKPATPKEKK